MSVSEIAITRKKIFPVLDKTQENLKDFNCYKFFGIFNG